MSRIFWSKSIMVAAWIVIGGGVFAGIGLIALGSYLHGFNDDLNLQWATLIATDPNIVELGDGMDVYPIDEKSLLHVGDVATIGDVQVSLLDLRDGSDNVDAVATPVGLVLGSIEYEVANVGQDVVFWPRGISFVQYVQGEQVSWRNTKRIDCSPTAARGTVTLEPSEEAICVESYWVPARVEAVYWLLDGNGADDYAVFQIQ